MAEPIIKKIMFEYNIDINYVSTDKFTVESESQFMNSNELLQSFVTPMLLVVSNNEIKDYLKGAYDREGYINFLEKNNFINDMEE